MVLVPSLRRTALQTRLPRGQKLIAPLRGPRCRDAQLPRHGLKILSAQQTQHHRALAPSRKPPLPVTLGGRSGRPPGLPLPPPIPQPASSSRYSSCENALAIKCPRKPWGAPAWPSSSSNGQTPSSGCWRSTPTEAPPGCDATSSGWTRQRKHDYLQTTVQEPWGDTIYLYEEPRRKTPLLGSFTATRAKENT